MRGASADALAGLRAQLDGAADSGDTAQLGTDLFGVAQVLRTEPGLRRIATDVATEQNAKSGLARSVFSGKVGDSALAVVADSFSRRWTSARDLADALEELGVIAVVKSAGEQGARLADELFSLGLLVNDHADLRDALSDPARSSTDKAALLHGLLDGKALPATVTLAQQALAGSYRTVAVAIQEFQKIASSVQGEGIAKVRVARPLSDADRDRLQQALTRQYGRNVHLNVVLEPDLVGGIRVEIGDDVIDGSVVSRLDGARRQLAG